MDTHILNTPETLASGSELAPEACLPGEGAPPLAAGQDERPRSSIPRRRRRGALLTTSSIAVVALAAGGVFLISPYNHIVPIHAPHVQSAARHVAASVDLPPAGPLAPAATLATAPLPKKGAPPVRKPVVAESKAAQLREFQSYHMPGPGHSGAPVKPAAALSAPPASPAPSPSRTASIAPRAVHEVGVSPPTPPPPPIVPVGGDPLSKGGEVATLASPAAPPTKAAPPAPGPVAAAAASSIAVGAPATPAAHAPPAAPSPAPDPVVVATHLRPAPTTEKQEIQVLSLVTQLGAIIRDQRAEIASLRADQQKTSSTDAARLDDFDRRLSLAEARGAIGAAMGAANTATSTAAATPTMPPAAASAGKPSVQLTKASTVAPAGSGPHRYRVQAASPGLAMLAEIDRGGGEGAQLQVAVGDTVPGYGKVTGISQHGTSWLVQTDHGAIR